MSGIIDSAAAIMRTSSSRVDRAALNIANISTPGFKRRLGSYSNVAAGLPAASNVRVDQTVGKLTDTGRPLDLAIDGAGFFQVRDGDQMLYSRQGNFALAKDGRLVTPQGHTLQQAGGGDLVLDSDAVRIAADGTVLAGDRPVGRVAVMQPGDGLLARPIDGTVFAIDDGSIRDVVTPSLRQGMLEASNVSVGDEMVSMMAGVREAETGARLVQAYDDLLGKAIGTFAQVGR